MVDASDVAEILEDHAQNARYGLSGNSTKAENGRFGLAVVRPLDRNPAAVYLVSLGSDISRRTMGYGLRRFANFYGYSGIETVPWEKIMPANVLLFKTALEREGKPPNTINLYIAALKGVVNAVWMMELVSDHQKLLFSAVKGARGFRLPRGRALTREETSLIIRTCLENDNAKSRRDAAMFALGIGCGLRRKEIADVRITGVDFSGRCVRVIGKNNKEREIPAGAAVLKLAENWLHARGTGGCPNLFVCCDRYGTLMPDRPMSPNAVFRMMQNRAGQAGDLGFSPHDLRRTYASRMLDAGADLSVVKETMGHASVQTTQRYDKRGIEKIRRYADKLAL